MKNALTVLTFYLEQQENQFVALSPFSKCQKENVNPIVRQQVGLSVTTTIAEIVNGISQPIAQATVIKQALGRT